MLSLKIFILCGDVCMIFNNAITAKRIVIQFGIDIGFFSIGYQSKPRVAASLAYIPTFFRIPVVCVSDCPLHFQGSEY